MKQLEQILWQSTIELSLLLAVILLARLIIRKTTKNYNAYLLWLAIPVGLLIAKLIAQIEFSSPPSAAVNYMVENYVVRPTQTLSNWSILVYIWLIISELVLLRLIWQHIDLKRKLSIITVDKKIPVQSKYPVIAIDKQGFSPAVYGFIKPKIYFPVHLLKQLSTQQIELIIKHEEHHITQRHLWLNLIWDIAVCLMWFNPLIYISRQSFRHDQELFCDYLVLNRSSRQQHQSYGHALLTTVSATHSVSLLCSWKMFNQLEERIMNIKKPTSFASKLSIALGAVAVIGCTSLYAVSMSKYSKLDKNGEHRIEWNIGGKTYVDKDGDWYLYENGEKRALTKAERREFEQAVERAEKDMLRAEAEIRHAEKEMQKHERDMELASKELEKAYQALEKNHQEIEQAYRNLETNYHDLEMDYAEGNIDKQQLQTIKQELRDAQEHLRKNQKQYQKDLQRVKEQLEISKERIHLESKGQRVPLPPKPESSFRVPPSPKPVSDIRVESPTQVELDIRVPPQPTAPKTVPLKTFPPKYPVNAMKNNISGHVLFNFDVDVDGKPYNIKVVDSVPEKVFDEAALAAIKKWEFRSSADGLKDVSYQLDFALE